jgi:hypothetical protein
VLVCPHCHRLTEANHAGCCYCGQRIAGTWYQGAPTQTAIRVYKTAQDAAQEADAAARSGWKLQSVSSSEGHLNGGRTFTGAALTGRLRTLFGGSRMKCSVTVTFTRDWGMTDTPSVPTPSRVWTDGRFVETSEGKPS